MANLTIPDYTLYRDHGGTLTACDYRKYAPRAVNYMAYVTMGRVLAHMDDDNALYCLAEIIDMIVTDAQIVKQTAEGDAITAETTGPYSAHYADTTGAIKYLKADQYAACRRWLSAWMYRGVPYV